MEDFHIDPAELDQGAGGRYRTPLAVSAGQTVHPGQLMRVLEAMKMEHEIRADLQAVITRQGYVPELQRDSRPPRALVLQTHAALTGSQRPCCGGRWGTPSRSAP